MSVVNLAKSKRMLSDDLVLLILGILLLAVFIANTLQPQVCLWLLLRPSKSNDPNAPKATSLATLSLPSAPGGDASVP